MLGRLDKTFKMFHFLQESTERNKPTKYYRYSMGSNSVPSSPPTNDNQKQAMIHSAYFYVTFVFFTLYNARGFIMPF